MFSFRLCACLVEKCNCYSKTNILIGTFFSYWNILFLLEHSCCVKTFLLCQNILVVSHRPAGKRYIDDLFWFKDVDAVVPVKVQRQRGIL